MEGVRPLFGGDHVVTVEIGSCLFELGEILNGLERALRAKQPLDLYAAQRRGDDAMTGFLRTGIGSKVRGLVGVAVRVAVEARCAAAGLLGAAVPRHGEVLLRGSRGPRGEALPIAWGGK